MLVTVCISVTVETIDVATTVVVEIAAVVLPESVGVVEPGGTPCGVVGSVFCVWVVGTWVAWDGVVWDGVVWDVVVRACSSPAGPPWSVRVWVALVAVLDPDSALPGVAVVKDGSVQVDGGEVVWRATGKGVWVVWVVRKEVESVVNVVDGSVTVTRVVCVSTDSDKQPMVPPRLVAMLGLDRPPETITLLHAKVSWLAQRLWNLVHVQ